MGRISRNGGVFVHDVDTERKGHGTQEIDLSTL